MNKKKIAIIGIAGQFPGAQDIGDFWKNLVNGTESISFLEKEEQREAGVEDSLINNPDYVPAKGFLPDIDYFDSAFFGYTPAEAKIMDPQVRIFHQCCWQALEDAGYDPGTFPGAIGLFAGASPNPFWEILPLRHRPGDESSYSEQWNAIQFSDKDYLSTRVAYNFDFKGPCITLQTACSTSLAAVDQAIHSLLSGSCDMALAGGVSITHHDQTGYLYQEGTILSPDGHCRPFSRDANGTVGGNGCGVVVLKRLEDALQDRDNTRAVIIGTGITNDGRHKAGFTAPSSAGQARAIRSALEMGGVSPDSIGYIETHGTGTLLGDPIEIEGLKMVFGRSMDSREQNARCALGSVKSNIGHLDAAAGIAGFIKTALILEHRYLPPTLHFNTPNPVLELENSPFYVNTRSGNWSGGRQPFRAGVSSFGLGGTNVHIVLEEWKGKKPAHAGNNGKPQLLILSARTTTALEKMSANLSRHFKQNPGIDIADAAYTLQVGRKSFNHRQAILASNIEEAVRQLETGNIERAVVEDRDPGIPGEMQPTLAQAGRLWLKGAPIDWRTFHTGGSPQRIPLPTYPFEGRRYQVDKDLFNTQLPELNGLTELRKNPDITEWFYVPVWTREALTPQTKKRDISTALLFIDGNGPGDLLRQRLELEGAVVITVTTNNSGGFRKISKNSYSIVPHEPEGYSRLVEELARAGVIPSHIFHFWSYSGDAGGGTVEEKIRRIMDRGFYSLLFLARALSDHIDGETVKISAVTGPLHEVTGAETLNPEHAPLYGLSLVLPQEFPNISIRCIDLPLTGIGDAPHQQQRQWVEELLSGFSAQQVAYRGNYRWIRSYRPVSIPSPKAEALPLKKKGVYLITGGTGAIGTILAKHLAKNSQAHLVITCRSKIPDRESPEWEKIREIETLGGSVRLVRADVSDKDQMQDVFRLARETFGAVNGVIHAAGIVGPQAFTALREMGEDDVRLHFNPKVDGLVVLAELLAHQPVDFCLVMSSTSSVLGGLGFGAYSAANYFMDAYVHFLNRSSRTRWLSVNWDGWHLDRQPIREDKLGEIISRLAMTPAEGMEVFERVLAYPEAVQVVQCSGHLQTRIQRWLEPKTGDVAAETEAGHDPGGSPSTTRSRPTLTIPYRPPQTPLEKELAEIWQDLLGFQKIGIEDSFFDLNGDSLKAVIAISRMQKQTGKKVSLKDFFAIPTIAGLTGITASGEEYREKPDTIPLLEKREYYPLSSSQMRMYLLDRISGESSAYHVPEALEVTGQLDLEKLTELFRDLIRRHEILRTSFLIVEDQPVQKVHETVDFSIIEIDPGGPVNTIISGFIRPFDLAHAPLFRVGLAELGKHKHLLLLDMHHIISDGTSMTLLLKEFLQLYRGNTLPEPSIQYKDYAGWQTVAMACGRLKEQGDFWLKELEGELPVLDLPYDYQRPLDWSYDGRQYQFELTKQESVSLNALAQNSGVTLYMTLVSIYTILLAKLAAAEEVVLGVPVAGRRNADVQDVLGLFTNTLTLRASPQPAKPFHRYLEELKSRILAAFENQDYPFEAVVEQKAVTRDPGRNPLFDAAFVFQNMEIPDSTSTGLTLKPFPADILSAKLDLSLIGEDIEDKLTFTFEYSTALFRADTMERFSRYFKQVVSAILAEPRQEIGEIEIITPEEKHQVLDVFNDTGRDSPGDTPVHQLFEEQAERVRNRCSIIADHSHITYSELDRKANRLMDVLKEKGVVPGSIVAIKMERSIEMVAGILGILKSGAAYLPIAHDLPQERTDYMLKDSNAGWVLTNGDSSPESADGLEIVYSADAMNCAPTIPTQPITHSPTQLCYIIYTSGSTGKPKGVMVEHGGLVNMLRFHRELFKEDQESRISQVSSISFDAMAFEIFPCLCAGAALCIIDNESRLEPGKLKDWLIKHRIESSFQSTAMAQHLLREQWPENSALNILRTAGDKLSGHPARAVPFRFFNLYGPTEDTIWTTWYEVPMDAAKENTPPPIGRPTANKQVYILDRRLKLQPPGIPGELCIAGSGLARGYLNRPELTQERFVPPILNTQQETLYRTGDLARWLHDGNIEFLGRIDHQVKIRGYRIELGEIENRLREHPGISESVVITREDSSSGTYLCAYVVPSGNYESSTQLTAGLHEYLSRFLPDYMVPAFIIALTEMPLNSSGKIDRHALPVPRRDSVTRLTPPQTPTEQKLASLWIDVLPSGHESIIGIDESFFALGGHSITAAALVSRIQKSFHIKMPLSQLFKNPTIRQLAVYIKDAAKEFDAPLEAVEQKDYYPLSSAQAGLYVEQFRGTRFTGYNVQAAVLLKGDLDREKLEQTFKHLIRRHEILRTSFQFVDDQPVQIVHDNVDFSIKDVNPGIRDMNVYEVDANTTKSEIQQSFSLPFDLAHAPLIRVTLIRRGEREHIVAMDLHHIIMDGASIGIFFKEFMIMYSGPGEKSLPNLPVQYKDFAQWQQKRRVSGGWKHLEAYWLQEFSGPLPRLLLATDYKRDETPDVAGDYVEFTIDGTETLELRKLAGNFESSLFMVLISIYYTMLSRLSGQEDIIVGTPQAGRIHSSLEPVLGHFVNTLPLRNFPAQDKRFSEFLNEVRDRVLAAFDHQDYPVVLLTEQLRKTGTASDHPLYDVLFVFQGEDMLAENIPRIKASGLTLTPYEEQTLRAPYDLILHAFDNNETLGFRLTYRTALFEGQTVENMAESYKTIVSAALTDTNIKIGDIIISHSLAAAETPVTMESEGGFNF